MGDQVVTIPDTGNIRVGQDLEIGAGNIWPDAADGGSGKLSAGLWILAKKVSAERKHRRVHAGDELTESGYTLKVLDIQKSPQAFVRVKVQAAR